MYHEPMVLWTVALIGLLLALSILILRLQNYHRLVGSRKYLCHYDFGQQPVPATLVDHSLSINQHQSVLLKVSIRSNASGWLFDPELTLQVENSQLRFTFERGCTGFRYLCIPKSIAAAELIQVSCRAMTLGSKIEAYSFPEPDLANAKILIVAPHPDDAEIMAFSLIHEFPENVWIATVTPGDKGQTFRNSTAPQAIVRSAAIRSRLHDSLTVAQQFGVRAENLVNLGYSEHEFSSHPDELPQPAEQLRSPKGSPLLAAGTGGSNPLVDDFVRLLHHIQPDVIVVPHPLKDSHDVHVGSVLALLDAIQKADTPLPHFYCSLVHIPEQRSYPIGQIGDGVALPPNQLDEKLFDSIFIREMNEEVQFLKAVALDSHRDLREPPLPYRKLVSPWAISRHALREKLSGAQRVASKDYYRRSIRACEIFLVYKPDSLENLRQDTIAALQAKSSRSNRTK